MAGRGIDVFEQPLHRPDQREPDTLHDTRVSQREWRGRNPADHEHDHREREDGEQLGSQYVRRLGVLDVDDRK